MSRSVKFVAEDARLYSHSPNVLVWSDPHSAGYRSLLVSTLARRPNDPAMGNMFGGHAGPGSYRGEATESPVVRDTITTEPKKGAEGYNIYATGAVAAGALANRRRLAASFLRIPCSSKEVDQNRKWREYKCKQGDVSSLIYYHGYKNLVLNQC